MEKDAAPSARSGLVRKHSLRAARKTRLADLVANQRFAPTPFVRSAHFGWVANQRFAPTPSCESLVRSLFGFNSLDVGVLKVLIRSGCMRTEEVAQAVGRERSTVCRSLQKLTSCGICEKKSNTLSGGGYCYTYAAKTREEIIADIESCIETWHASMRESLNEFAEMLDGAKGSK